MMYTLVQISVFWVTDTKILGRVGTHIFIKKKILEKSIILCILKGISPFKMHKIFFSQKSWKNPRLQQ